MMLGTILEVIGALVVLKSLYVILFTKHCQKLSTRITQDRDKLRKFGYKMLVLGIVLLILGWAN